MGQSALCPAKMKRCPAQGRTANAIDTTPAPRKDVAAPAARPTGQAAEKAAQKTPTSRSGGQRGTSTWWYKVPAHGERARCNFVLHNAILLARAAGDRHPTSSAAYLLMGLRPQWRTFVPAAYAASVHPCAHSTGRAGFGYPFPSMPTPGPWWAVRPPATLDQQTVYLLVSDIIVQELAVVNPLPYPSATSRIIITVKPAAKASAPGPGSPRVGSSSAATT